MALFSRQHLKGIVCIERKKEADESEYESIATGFLVGFTQKDDPDPAKKTYRLFLITNRHVFGDMESLYVRFDIKGSQGTKRFPIQLKKGDTTKWLAHKDPDVDLALYPLNSDVLKEHDIDWIFFHEDMIAYPDKYSEIGIELGDSVYILGFPMGISGGIQNYAVVRAGTLARLDKEIIEQLKSILVDATVFPGNSGGPVLLKPESATLKDTKAVSSVYLLGVISSYIPYREKLYSLQSSPPLVAAISIENSGLARVVPMSFAREIYDEFSKSSRKMEDEIKAKGKSIG